MMFALQKILLFEQHNKQFANDEIYIALFKVSACGLNMTKKYYFKVACATHYFNCRSIDCQVMPSGCELFF